MLNVAKMMFDQQKRGAARRNIEFDFTFDEWTSWWESHLGTDWTSLRGLKKGQYVMARYYDSGPYAIWNVKCITVGRNSSEANLGRRKGCNKLTKKEAKLIFLSAQTTAEISKQFKISRSTIACIKKGKIWVDVTKGLSPPKRLKGSRGAETYNALLTDEKVIAIRKSQKTRNQLAKQYGVHYNTICNILSGRQWKHLL